MLLPIILVATAYCQAAPILPEEAKEHVGENVSVRGLVEQNLRISCNLCGVFGSCGIERDRADLKGYYGTDDVRVHRKRFHLGPLVQDNEITIPALEGNLRRSHESVIGGLGLSGNAVCSDLVDPILKRLCVIATAGERESLVWRRGNAWLSAQAAAQPEHGILPVQAV